MNQALTVEQTLPVDAAQATLVGRAFLPTVEGPALVTIRDGEVFDLSEVAPTASALFEFEHPAATVRKATALPRIGCWVSAGARSLLSRFLTAAFSAAWASTSPRAQ